MAINVLIEFLRSAEKIVIMGIGNELRRDDALGVIIARELKRKLKGIKNVLVIDCGEVPENFLGVIERFKPTHVIIIDAIEIGAEPGTLGIISGDQVMHYPTISTHRISPHILISYIEEIVGAKTIIIGIQPENIDFGEGLTERVMLSVKEITKMLANLIMRCINVSQNN
ncbi:MAG: hydrogenase maturation peptidase HycI [Candidatus Methanomethylicota archaeon]|uniref:Hydrogenase maturation peptidase HycI n=1 Tax=Thermoproteota archaeon TaxID=2056631 RepID=A0A497ES61_9CREN|nr:MAG: hydrogenase maturation peptidase HycI [Candidatus Verstraetearchaeota archaeon]